MMNGTEKDYGAYLELLKKSGEILDYSFECETLKIGQDCRYTPDFRVIRQVCSDDPTVPMYSEIEFHEVKGTVRKKRTNQIESLPALQTKPFIEDDALVKIKAAAVLHPYKFIIVWKGIGGQWEKREIN